MELGGGGIGEGSDDDHAALDGRGTIGHGSAGGDGGSDLVSEEGFAAAVIAIEEGDASRWETVVPEPGDGLRC